VNKPGKKRSKRTARPRVFISYSHLDKKWKEKVVTHLKVLQREGQLAIWVDSDMEAGSDWLVQITGAIQTARVALLLVSADFLTSPFIAGTEVPRLLKERKKRGLHIFPVILRTCAWKKVHWLTRMLVRPEDGRPLARFHGDDRDKVFTAIAEEVHSLLRARRRRKKKRKPSD
jgi:hypothetical protein